MSKVTLRVIAEETGLSKYAVSRALSGKTGVSSETRARVVEVAERLGYRPPAAARPQLAGAVFDGREHANGELLMQVQTGLQTEAARLGYALRLHFLHESLDMANLVERCCGILAVNLRDGPELDVLNAAGIPVVRHGWVEPLDPVDTVSGTDHEAGAAVARHLLELGHREVVYVHGPVDLRGRRERLYGLTEVLGNVEGAVIHDVTWAEEDGFSARLSALLEKGHRPTAFFCAHDGLALTAVSDLLARGWRIPDDVSVIGFGDFSAASLIRPALTTVRVHGIEMGRAAMRLLDARVRDADFLSTPVRIQIPNTLILRESSAPAPEHTPARKRRPRTAGDRGDTRPS